MRLANLAGRASVVADGRAVDVATASDGRFGPDPQSLFDDWPAFAAWAASAPTDAGEEFDPRELGPPVPRPRQIFAIGVNYAEHAAEAGYPSDTLPVTFTKFPSCLTGPFASVELATDTVDWEVELVVAIGVEGRHVARDDAWSHIAGLTVGQDLSERTSQLAGAKPQFSLAKSFPGFGPTGPWLVTPDEFDDPEDLAISCALGEETMQSSRTSQMVYTVPHLIERLSGVCALLPGDLVFTGTPSGVGNARTPKRFLGPADVLRSEIEGVGEIETTFRERSAR